MFDIDDERVRTSNGPITHKYFKIKCVCVHENEIHAFYVQYVAMEKAREVALKRIRALLWK